jgi:hypothetical protein
MTEIEVYQKVLEENGCVFVEEHSNLRSGGSNYLQYYHVEFKTTKVYFKVKTGVVSNIFFDLVLDDKTYAAFKKHIKETVRFELRDSIINEVLNT